MDKASFDDVLGRADRRNWKPATGNGPVLKVRYPQSIEASQRDAAFVALERVELAAAFLDVPLRLTGGGYGCVDFEFSSDSASAPQLDALLDNETFVAALNQTAATEVSITRTSTPKSWVRMSSHQIFVFTNRAREGQGFGAESADAANAAIYEVELPVEQVKTPTGKHFWQRLAPTLFQGSKPKPQLKMIRELSVEDNAAAVAQQEGAALLHIHGIATPFRDAVLGTAELARNLENDKLGLVPCLFTWPADRPATDYDGHIRMAERSEKPLAEVLAALGKHATPMNVVAHSHGNKILLRAAAKLKEDKIIREAILVAPDVDHVVMEDLLPDLARIFEHATVYFCSRDIALTLSEAKFGDARAGTVAIDVGQLNVDCINVDSIVRGAIAHSYHADTQLVVSDMHYALAGMPAARRYGLTPGSGPRLFTYAALRKAA